MSIRPSKSSKSNKLIRTFTYFIPAPPARKNGYREREFDKIMNGILQSGFEIIELKTQSVDTGLFVFALLKPANKKVALLDEGLDMQDRFKLAHKHTSPDFVLDEEDA